MKTNTNQNQNQNSTVNPVNPFESLTAVESKGFESRRLDYTPVLIDRANTRASEIMLKGSEHAELANRVINDGNTSDLLELINATVPEGQIEADAEVLEGCDADQLSRLLESRRSDRSKAKKKGLTSSVVTCKTYISAMYAELMIRVKMGKPYTGAAAAQDYNAAELAQDQDALSRKIKSLQSKQCRLKKLAAFDEAARAELDEVVAEIARLNDLRTGTRRVSKTVLKDANIDAIRETLKSIDPATLPEAEQAKFLELMAKIG